MDGAKLVSVNNLDEHSFIVRWLRDHARQGYTSFCTFVSSASARCL